MKLFVTLLKFQNPIIMKKTILSLLLVLSYTVLMSQNYVTTEPQDKNAIIEEFTGVRCPNCPDGHLVVADILLANPERAFVVAYHPTNSSFTTPYTGDPDFRRNYPDVFYTTPYCGTTRFMPSAFVNRREWANGERIQSRTEWAAYCNTIMAEPSPVNVGLGTNYDSTTEEISITVEIYYTQDMTDANHVYVMLAENDLVSQQSGGTSSYVHKHTFREAYIAQWGDLITDPTTQGSLITLEFMWDATGSGYIPSNCEVIAFVENQTDAEIITGVGVQLGESTTIGIDSEVVLQNPFNIYPNPTEGKMYIEQQVAGTINEIIVRNVCGQQVVEHIPDGNVLLSIDLGTLESGLYFVECNTSNGVYQEKILLK